MTAGTCTDSATVCKWFQTGNANKQETFLALARRLVIARPDEFQAIQWLLLCLWEHMAFGRNSSDKHQDFNSGFTGFNHICKLVLL